MEEELQSLIKACVSTILALSYCYYLPPRIKAGVFRLISIIPICALFLALPLLFSSAHFTFITSTFLTWHANFKLILFAFDKGPLFPFPLNLTQFICFTYLPFHRKQNPKPQDHYPKYLFAVKIVIFGVALHLYDYRQNLPSILLSGLYSLHVYLVLEIPLTILKELLGITFGCEFEPLFNEPYLATSLQDFWGRRWNLASSAILRLTVYIPVRRVCQNVMNTERAIIVGVLASFLVSGLLHELVFFYVTRETPTWEVTWYFVLHGVCTVVEGVVAKKKTVLGEIMVRRPMVSRLLTVGFVIVTGGWLFFPQFKWSGVMERFVSEFLLFNAFVKRELFLFLGNKLTQET